MTITSGHVSSAGEFLAESGAAPGNSQTLDERFVAALEKSLSEAGIGSAEVEIQGLDAVNGDSQNAVIRLKLESTIAPAGVTGTGSGETNPVAGASEGLTSSRGPQITRDMWTEELLTADLSSETLGDVQNPADLLNARLEAVRSPTEATIKNLESGSGQRINSSILATREQAETMLERLRALGLSDGGIEEWQPVSGHYALEYNGEVRRCFNIDGMSVGMLVERYAKYPVEVADEMTLAELSQGSTA